MNAGRSAPAGSPARQRSGGAPRVNPAEVMIGAASGPGDPGDEALRALDVHARMNRLVRAHHVIRADQHRHDRPLRPGAAGRGSTVAAGRWPPARRGRRDRCREAETSSRSTVSQSAVRAALARDQHGLRPAPAPSTPAAPPTTWDRARRRARSPAPFGAYPIRRRAEMNVAPAARMRRNASAGSLKAAISRWIVRRTHDQELIPHQRYPIDQVTSGDGALLLGGGRVRHHHVGLAALGELQRLAAADGDHADVQSQRTRPRRHEAIEQTRVHGSWSW